MARSLVASLCVAVAFGLTLRFRDIANAERETQAVIARAEIGDVRAQVRLSMMYLSGNSVRRDPVQAASWMRNAAENADPEAMFRLGVMYLRGWGVPQDPASGSRWLLRSADKGYPDAVRQVAALYASGEGALDSSLALLVLRRAAETGNAEAQNTLGLAYHLGRGIEQDDRKAVQWFRLAADQGHATALTNLGWMYQQGLGAAQDSAVAFALFTKAAGLGVAEAQFLLGQIYEAQGDEAQAALWLRKAAASVEDPLSASDPQTSHAFMLLSGLRRRPGVPERCGNIVRGVRGVRFGNAHGHRGACSGPAGCHLRQRPSASPCQRLRSR
jgi:TPR repeat protein